MTRARLSVWDLSAGFVIRTPALPDAVWRIGGLAAGEACGRGASDASLGAALAFDAAATRARLDGLLARRDVREAIALASPSLDASLTAALDDRSIKRERAVYGYLT